LAAFGIDDAIDIYDQELCYLATFGQLGRGGASLLRTYIRDKILMPLDLLPTKFETSVEIDPPTDDSRIFKWRAEIEPEHVEEIEVSENIKEGEEGVDEVEEGTGDESMEVEEIEGWGDVAYGTQEEV